MYLLEENSTLHLFWSLFDYNIIILHIFLEFYKIILFQSTLIFVAIKSWRLSLWTIFYYVPNRTASKTTAPFYVQSFLIFRTLPSNVSLLTTIKTICQLILLLRTISMIVIFWTTLKAKAFFRFFCFWAFFEQVFSGSAF